MPDLDKLPWGPPRDSGATGQFKASAVKMASGFDKFIKTNDDWNKHFSQMFLSGKIGQDMLRGMLSGNFIKMLGLGGIAGVAAAGMESLAATGASRRFQAAGFGGNIGKMQAAQIELARFGDVNAGLQAMMEAQHDPGSAARQDYAIVDFP